jgi:hypothetical protein
VKFFKMVLATSGVDAARSTGSLAHNALTYVGYFVHWHGVTAALLTLTGLVVVLRKQGPARIPALVALTTFALLLTQPYTVARAMSTAIPTLCLCAAAGLFWIMRVCRRHRYLKTTAVTVLLMLFLAPALKGSVHLYRGRSSVADACAFVASHGPAAVAVPIDTYHRSKYWLYLEGTGIHVVSGNFHNLGSPEAVVARLRNEGVRRIIIDPQRWHFRDTPPGDRNRVFRWWEKMDDYLSREACVGAEFSHVVDYCWEFLSEGPGLTHLDEMIRRRAGKLRVYDLSGCGPVASR